MPRFNRRPSKGHLTSAQGQTSRASRVCFLYKPSSAKADVRKLSSRLISAVTVSQSYISISRHSVIAEFAQQYNFEPSVNCQPGFRRGTCRAYISQPLHAHTYEQTSTHNARKRRCTTPHQHFEPAVNRQPGFRRSDS